MFPVAPLTAHIHPQFSSLLVLRTSFIPLLLLSFSLTLSILLHGSPFVSCDQNYKQALKNIANKKFHPGHYILFDKRTEAFPSLTTRSLYSSYLRRFSIFGKSAWFFFHGVYIQMHVIFCFVSKRQLFYSFLFRFFFTYITPLMNSMWCDNTYESEVGSYSISFIYRNNTEV